MEKIQDLLSKFIDSYYNKNNGKRKAGRPCLFPTFVYVKYIFRVLLKISTWNKLKPHYQNKRCTGNAIFKKFDKWTKEGVIKLFYLKYLKKYANKFKNIDNFYIDSTVIQNGNNSQNVGFSPKIKNKKSIKLSIICDKNKVVTDMYVSKSNIHDSKLILPVIKNTTTVVTNKAINLIGDLGYITNKETLKKLKKQKVKLITPVRKNMKKKLSKSKKLLLKKRYNVEHVFSLLKRSFKKINQIFERKIQNYYSWIYIASTYEMLKYVG